MKSEQDSEDSYSTSKTMSTCLHSDTPHYPVSWCQPLYKPWDQYSYFEMVFIDKPQRLSLIQIGYEKQWHVRGEKDYINNDEEMKSLFSDEVFTIVFTGSRSLSHPFLKAQLYKSNVLISAIPHVHKLTIDKWDMYSRLQDFLKSYGTSVEQLKLVPDTYLMSELIQSQSVLQHLKERQPNSMWLFKPRTDSGGRGIEVIDSTLQLVQKIVSSDETIVQEYIHNLLLLEGCKFDIRAFILIANTQPYMLFHHDGYLRVSLKAYDPKGSHDAHLTNTCIQAEQPDFSPDKHYWFYDRFQTYLDQHHPDNNNFVANKLIPYIKKTAILLLHSGFHLLERAPSCFQLIGLDFMVSTDWNIWFIEVNGYPGSRTFGYMSDYHHKQKKDMLDLVMIMRQTPQIFLDMPVGEWFRSWQLIWKENPPDCPLLDRYNPLLDFNGSS